MCSKRQTSSQAFALLHQKLSGSEFYIVDAQEHQRKGKRTRFLDLTEQLASVLFTDESRFILESDLVSDDLQIQPNHDCLKTQLQSW
ncbi:hypothetical protein TNCV_4678051 [Trichonephila clavipes]|nr:hypothetical protein TNCV_4678051 [Trichonephila clavipes]